MSTGAVYQEDCFFCLSEECWITAGDVFVITHTKDLLCGDKKKKFNSLQESNVSQAVLILIEWLIVEVDL